MATITIDFNKLPYMLSYNLVQGDDLIEPWQLQILTEDNTTYADFSLVGCSIKLYVKQDDTVIINGTAQTVDTASEGKFTFRIPAATTATWTGEYVYEVELNVPVGNTHFPTGCIKTICKGRIKILLDI